MPREMTGLRNAAALLTGSWRAALTDINPRPAAGAVVNGRLTQIVVVGGDDITVGVAAARGAGVVSAVKKMSEVKSSSESSVFMSTSSAAASPWQATSAVATTGAAVISGRDSMSDACKEPSWLSHSSSIW
jgi:hypothetical protein